MNNAIKFILNKETNDSRKVGFLLMHRKEVFEHIGDDCLSVEDVAEIIRLNKKLDKTCITDIPSKCLKAFAKNDYEYIKKYRDDIIGTEWNYIYRYCDFTEDFIEYLISENIINWDLLSSSQELSEDFILKYKDKLDLCKVFKHNKITEKFIEDNKDLIDWDSLSCNYKLLSEDFVRKYKDNLNWTLISSEFKMTEDFMEEFKNYLNWKKISFYQKLSETFINKYKDLLYWEDISYRQDMTEEFIIKHDKYIDWKRLSISSLNLSENFMRRYIDKINFNSVSYREDLSNDFIDDFKDKLNWENISIRHELTEEFIDRYKEYLEPYFEDILYMRLKLPDNIINKISNMIDY